MELIINTNPTRRVSVQEAACMPLYTTVHLVHMTQGALSVETHTLEEWLLLFDSKYTLASSFRTAREARVLRLDHMRNLVSKNACFHVGADKNLFYLQIDGTRIVELGVHATFDEAEVAAELWKARESQKAQKDNLAWVPGMTYIHDYTSLRNLQDSIKPLLT